MEKNLLKEFLKAGHIFAGELFPSETGVGIGLTLSRNQPCLNGAKTHKNTVNLEWVDNGNLGDSLGSMIYSWMLQRRGNLEN